MNAVEEDDEGPDEDVEEVDPLLRRGRPRRICTPCIYLGLLNKYRVYVGLDKCRVYML